MSVNLTKKTVATVSEMFEEIIKTAKNNNVFARVLKFEGRFYFCVCTHNEDFAVLDDKEKMFAVVDRLRTKADDKIYLDYNLLDITDVDRSNWFYFNEEAVRLVQYQAITKAAFYSCNYPDLPQWMFVSSIEHLRELDKLRNMDVGAELKERWIEEYKTFVDNAYDLYAREVQKPRKQRVSARMFTKGNTITMCESVSDGAWKYMRKKLKKYPQFTYHKDILPYKRSADYSRFNKMFTRMGEENPWAGEEQKKYYHIMFPYGCQSIYYNLINEYVCKDLTKLVSAAELELNTKEPLQLNYVMQCDLKYLDQMCAEHGVRYALDHGRYSPITYKSVGQVPLLFRAEDAQIVAGIMQSMASVSREAVAVSKNVMFDAMHRTDTAYMRKKYKEKNGYDLFR